MKATYRYLILCIILIIDLTIVGSAQPDQRTKKRGADSPPHVSQEKDKFNPLDNLRKWAWHFLSERYDYEKECTMTHLYARRTGENDSLVIPLLEGPRILAAVKRPFCLSWQGGSPPYRIRLYHQYERKPFIEREPVKENSLKIEDLALSPGNYSLNINDAEGRKLQAKFTVVDPNEVPQMPYQKDLRQRDWSQAAKITLHATWLAAQNDGKWVFESYQQVAGFADEYHPAFLLRNALAGGQRPVLGQMGDSEPSTQIEQ